jgi:hypothetical protein
MKVIGASPVLLEVARASEGAPGLHDPTGRLRRRRCGFLGYGTGVTLSRRDGLLQRRPRVPLCGEMDPAKTAPSQESSDHSGIGSVHQWPGGAGNGNAKSREASGRWWAVRRFAYFLVLVLSQQRLSMAAVERPGPPAQPGLRLPRLPPSLWSRQPCTGRSRARARRRISCPSASPTPFTAGRWGWMESR